jgi:hypothetical protein
MFAGYVPGMSVWKGEGQGLPVSTKGSRDQKGELRKIKLKIFNFKVILYAIGYEYSKYICIVIF